MSDQTASGSRLRCASPSLTCKDYYSANVFTVYGHPKMLPSPSNAKLATEISFLCSETLTSKWLNKSASQLWVALKGVQGYNIS